MISSENIGYKGGRAVEHGIKQTNQQFFTYPEGWQQMVDSLNFVPQEMRTGLLQNFIAMMLIVG
jgi:hypothetical protein